MSVFFIYKTSQNISATVTSILFQVSPAVDNHLDISNQIFYSIHWGKLLLLRCPCLAKISFYSSKNNRKRIIAVY